MKHLSNKRKRNQTRNCKQWRTKAKKPKKTRKKERIQAKVKVYKECAKATVDGVKTGLRYTSKWKLINKKEQNGTCEMLFENRKTIF